jgi:hypothetical protein
MHGQQNIKLYFDIWDQQQLPTCWRFAASPSASPSVCLTLKMEELRAFYRVFLFLLDRLALPQHSVCFITLSKGHYHCDLLSSYRRRLLNLPDRRRTTYQWQGVGLKVRPTFISQVRKKKHPGLQYQPVQTHVSCRSGHVPRKLYGDDLRC